MNRQAQTAAPATPGFIKDMNYEVLESAERDRNLLRFLELESGSHSSPTVKMHLNYGSLVDDTPDHVFLQQEPPSSDQTDFDSPEKRLILLESKYRALEKELAMKQNLLENAAEEERRKKLGYFLESDRFQLSRRGTGSGSELLISPPHSSTAKASPSVGIAYEQNILQRLQHQLLQEVVNYAKLEASFDRSQEELSVAEHQIKKSEEEVSQLQQALLHSREELARKVKVIEDMQSASDKQDLDFIRLSESNDATCATLRETISELENRAAALSANVDELRTVSQELSDELVLRMSDFQKVQSERNLLEVELKSLEVTQGTLFEKISSLEMSLKDAICDKDSISQLLSLTESESAHWQEKYEGMEKAFNELKEDLSSCESQTEAVIAAAKDEIARYSAQSEAIVLNLKTCQEDLKQALKELIKVEAERDDLKFVLRNNEDKYKELQSELARSMTDSQKQVSSLQTEVTAVNNQLQILSLELTAKVEESRKIEIELSQTKGIISSTEEELGITKAQLQEALKHSSDTNTDLASTRLQLQDVQSELARSMTDGQKQVSSLQTEVTSVNNQLQMLSLELTAKSLENEQVKLDLLRSEEVSSVAKEELGIAKAQFQEALQDASENETDNFQLKLYKVSLEGLTEYIYFEI